MAERFSASVAGRHMACHASANLPLAIPNWVEPVDDRLVDNAANQGTTIHEILAEIWALPTARIKQIIKVLEYVVELLDTRRFKRMIEQGVKAVWLVAQPGTTADLVLYTQDEIHVVDTKMGKIRVEVRGNEQLMFYALAYSHLAPRAKGVTVHIAQPAAENFESWFISTTELKQFMQDTIDAEAAIQAGDVTFGPSDHCTFCPANPHGRGQKGKPLCPAMMRLLYPPMVDEAEVLSL